MHGITCFGEDQLETVHGITCFGEDQLEETAHGIKCFGEDQLEETAHGIKCFGEDQLEKTVHNIRPEILCVRPVSLLPTKRCPTLTVHIEPSFSPTYSCIRFRWS